MGIKVPSPIERLKRGLKDINYEYDDTIIPDCLDSKVRNILRTCMQDKVIRMLGYIPEGWKKHGNE